MADRYGITHLDQINDDPRLTALFDTDSDGKAEIYGCAESWGCEIIIDSQIAFSRWDNIEQITASYTAGYDTMIGEAETRVADGEPVVVFTWGPSAYIAQLRPGDNVVWLAVEEVLDDSNPTGVDGGGMWAQLPGRADHPARAVPGGRRGGTCQLGWRTNDIRVTANKDFLRANPAARALLEQVKLPLVDVSRTITEQDVDRHPDRLADEWIAANRVHGRRVAGRGPGRFLTAAPWRRLRWIRRRGRPTMAMCFWLPRRVACESFRLAGVVRRACWWCLVVLLACGGCCDG